MNLHPFKVAFLLVFIGIVSSCDNDEMVSTPTDDFIAIASISPENQTIDEGDGGLSLTVNISANNTSGNALSLGYALSGSAELGADYSISQENVIIPVGTSSAEITITIEDDEAIEVDETITLTLDLSETPELSTGNSQATITITDNDDVDEPEIPDPAGSSRPNILLIIADDMGLDATNGYSEGSTKPRTPHLDEIMNNGLRFTNLWVNPTCSPTRAAILTGKYGIRTNVIAASDPLDPSEIILHSYIEQNAPETYANALIGKWHLSNGRNANPQEFGMDHFAGLISGAVGDYYDWELNVNGNTTAESSYITEKFTDLSIDWIADQEQPWFLWLAYNAPHTPFHVPPSEMHSQGALVEDQSAIDDEPLPYYLAAIEAMDYQIGRLLASIPQEELDNTIIIFIGDNGTPGSVAQAPYERGKTKGSVYQGGVNTPMFISGYEVNRVGTEEAMINGTDLFATIATLAGATTSALHDSYDFSSLFQSSGQAIRDYLYSEAIDDNRGSNEWAVRNERYKLIENSLGERELYYLIEDPYEIDNLLNGSLDNEAQSALENLELEIQRIRG